MRLTQSKDTEGLSRAITASGFSLAPQVPASLAENSQPLGRVQLYRLLRLRSG